MSICLGYEWSTCCSYVPNFGLSTGWNFLWLSMPLIEKKKNYYWIRLDILSLYIFNKECVSKQSVLVIYFNEMSGF